MRRTVVVSLDMSDWCVHALWPRKAPCNTSTTSTAQEHFSSRKPLKPTASRFGLLHWQRVSSHASRWRQAKAGACVAPCQSPGACGEAHPGGPELVPSYSLSLQDATAPTRFVEADAEGTVKVRCPCMAAYPKRDWFTLRQKHHLGPGLWAGGMPLGVGAGGAAGGGLPARREGGVLCL